MSIKKNKRNFPFSILCLTACLLSIGSINAQVIHRLPPNQPEQDACNALTLCGNNFNTPYSYTGTGKILDLNETPCAQGIGGGEVNSVWFRLNVSASGKMLFKIKPVNPDDDYDFAVLNITKTRCSYLKPAHVVRCNFNNNAPGSNAGGIVGLNLTSTTPYVQAGETGSSFCQAIDAVAGESYLIMVNNFGNYVNPNSGSAGFTIDFTGSTATFNNTGLAPALSSINPLCGNASIVLHLNSEVLCNSIAPDGSDFSTTAPAAIASAQGVNCDGSAGYTNSIIINFKAPLPSNNYTLTAQKGSDSNTLLNLCNTALTLPSDKIPFIISSTGITTSINESICYADLPYKWNGINVTKGGDDAAEYTTVSDQGCDSTTILNLTVSKPAIQSQFTKTICSYESYVLPWDSTVTSPGTYIHHYLNSTGCDSIVQQVTVNVSNCPQYFFVPSAFTPNADNRNDIFRPLFQGRLLLYNFRIYNRWGKQIFATGDFFTGWDGTIDGSPQPAGTYIWLCEYQLFDQPLHAEKGTVTLIR